MRSISTRSIILGYDERGYPIVQGTLKPWFWRGDGSIDVFEVFVICPFCGRQHIHGGGYDGSIGVGYRESHCRDLAVRGTYNIYVPAVKLAGARRFAAERKARIAEITRRREARRQA
jgi:hypothetical protein